MLLCRSWQQAHRMAEACMEQGIISGLEYIPVSSGDTAKSPHAVRLILQTTEEDRPTVHKLASDMSLQAVQIASLSI